MACIGAAAVAVAAAGCEADGIRSSRTIATQIISHADSVCAHRQGTANIAWMEKRVDDVVITCKDGTNHYYDG